MLYSAAYAFVARAMSRGSDTDRTASAKDAIAEAIETWNLRRDWRFLAMDTRNGFSVTACTVGSLGATHATNGFAGVNIGQTVTSSNAADFVTPTNRTITAVAADGSSVSWAVASDGAGGSGRTLTFSADIPMISGTDLYNLPTAIKRIYDVRLLINERPLAWKDERMLDRIFLTRSSSVMPAFYNNYNDGSFSTVKEYGRIRLSPIPSVADTIRVKYHRLISQPSSDSDLIDMPARYVYSMLTMARYYFMLNYDAENPRTATFGARAEDLFRKCTFDDQSGSVDRDVVGTPYIEWGMYRQVYDGSIIFY
jgi:hypothetical protein